MRLFSLTQGAICVCCGAVFISLCLCSDVFDKIDTARLEERAFFLLHQTESAAIPARIEARPCFPCSRFRLLSLSPPLVLCWVGLASVATKGEGARGRAPEPLRCSHRQKEATRATALTQILASIKFFPSRCLSRLFLALTPTTQTDSVRARFD